MVTEGQFRDDDPGRIWRFGPGNWYLFRSVDKLLILSLLLCNLPARAQNLPPAGFSVAASGSAGNSRYQFGQHVSMTLDANGAPALAFLAFDPDSDGNLIDSRLYFVSWDLSSGRWKEPAEVDIVGYVNSGAVHLVSIARDSSTNWFGIAYVKGTNEVWIAFLREDGSIWTKQRANDVSHNVVAGPSLAMAGGIAHLTYYHDSPGIPQTAVRYRTGLATDPMSRWFGGGMSNRSEALEFRPESSLALDSNGNMGVAYWLKNNSGGGVALIFLRTADYKPVKVTEVQGPGNEHLDVALAFAGTQPRIAFVAPSDNELGSATDQVWFTYSNDGGVTWSTPTAIPSDGTGAWVNRIALAVSPAETAVVSELGPVNATDAACGEPKLSRGVTLASWTTCSPSGGIEPVLRARFPSAVYAPDGTLYIAFQNTDPISIGHGVVVWRAGLERGAGPPAISGIVNAASYQPGIAPGALFSVFGSNLASGIAETPTVALPLQLLGTQVFSNGKLCPVHYVNPKQINAQMPFEIAPGRVTVVVRTPAGDSAPTGIDVLAAAPGIFLLGASRAAAQNHDYTLNQPANPAIPGTAVMVYLTGVGVVDNPVSTGQPAPLLPLSRALQRFTVSISGRPADAFFVGLTPDSVGLAQINVWVPDLPPGDYPVVVTGGDFRSNPALIAIGKR